MEFNKEYFEKRLVSGNYWSAGKYEGEVDQEGLCHGKGKWTSDDGTFLYDGDWRHGRFDGWGWFYFDEFVYEGLFSEGVFHYDGRLFRKNGKLIYDGLWKDGVCYDYSFQCFLALHFWPTYVGRRVSMVLTLVLSLIWVSYVLVAVSIQCAVKAIQYYFPEHLVTFIILVLFQYFTLFFEGLQNTQGRKYIVGIQPKWIIFLHQKTLNKPAIKTMDGLVKCHRTDCKKQRFGYSRCSRCRAVVFCSSYCAKKFWSKHRVECDRLKEGKEFEINTKKQKKVDCDMVKKEIEGSKRKTKKIFINSLSEVD